MHELITRGTIIMPPGIASRARLILTCTPFPLRPLRVPRFVRYPRSFWLRRAKRASQPKTRKSAQSGEQRSGKIALGKGRHDRDDLLALVLRIARKRQRGMQGGSRRDADRQSFHARA